MGFAARARRALIGAPKDITLSVVGRLSLIPMLAWLGLGADGLSSSAYGPAEAFRALGEHTGLAIFLSFAIAITVFVISAGYSSIIEQFPAGGGGYVVASKMLGARAGAVSGAALLVDYALTIAISCAAGADAVLSCLPPEWHALKMYFVALPIAVLTLFNLRGLKEPPLPIPLILIAFLSTHIVLIVAGIGMHAGRMETIGSGIETQIRGSVAALGIAGTLGLFLRAYAFGAGTYTGIEAVSNAVPMMREPKVENAKKTMRLMAFSLAFMASGIVVCYLLFGVAPRAGETMNAVLAREVTADWVVGGAHLGPPFVVLTLLAEAGLLFIAAQVGFVDGPRVMANMATDSWLPHRFSALSDRLTMRNGVLLMSAAATAVLVFTGASVSKLIVMYSLNVFLTFSLSNIAMLISNRRAKQLFVHGMASILCVTIFAVTMYEKFFEGAWLTLLITAALVALCFLIKRHYQLVSWAIELLDVSLPGPEHGAGAKKHYEGLLGAAGEGAPRSTDPVAIVFVGSYSALGRSTITTLLRMFPNHFHGIILVSIAIVDSGLFKGTGEIRALEERTKESLKRYEAFARALGMRTLAVTATGTEIAVEAEKVVSDQVLRFPQALVVAGQLIFEEDTLWYRALHNETAFLIQRRLQHLGIPMIVLPVQLDLRTVDPWRRWRRYLRLSSE